MLTVRAATLDDLRTLYGGDLPADWVADWFSGQRLDGYAAEDDGRLVAVGFVTWDVYGRPWGWFNPSCALSPVAMHRRAVRLLRKLARDGETTLLTFCSVTVPGAAKWLQRLGFRPAPELTTDPNHPVWKCDLSSS